MTTFISSLSKQMAWAFPTSLNMHRQVVSQSLIRSSKKVLKKSMIMHFSSSDTSSQYESNSEADSNISFSIQNDFGSSNGEKIGWRTLNDWEDTSTGTVQSSKESISTSSSSSFADYTDLRPTFTTSPIEKCVVRDRILYLKRDDLLRLPNSNISGNKARKLYALNNIPAHSFPKLVISYGGPQSNAMLALAAIVHSKNYQNQKNVDQIQKNSKTNDPNYNMSEPNEKKSKHEKKNRFLYYTKKLPRWLRKTPSGNFLRATSLGMEIVELSPAMYTEMFGGEDGGSVDPPSEILPPSWAYGDTLWVPQGGATGVAIPGTCNLAKEIYSFWMSQSSSSSSSSLRRKLSVCVPGGTCTTALFLQRALNNYCNERKTSLDNDIVVVVIPCVGDFEYAKRQMVSLDLVTGGDGVSNIPYILPPFPSENENKDSNFDSSRQSQYSKKKEYFTFGQPHPDILSTFFEMKDEYDICLDLLYGATAWTILLRHWEKRGHNNHHTGFLSKSPLDGREIMYVHSGGLEGNASQMTRYKQKGFLSPEQVM